MNGIGALSFHPVSSAKIRGKGGFRSDHGFSLNLRLVAKTAQPMDFRLAAKPCHLPLGIVAVSLLGGLKRLLACKSTTNIRHSVLVSEKSQRPGGFTVLLNQPLCLFDQPGFEHLVRAAVDSLIERLPIRIETQTQNAEAAQGLASALPQFRHLLSRRQAYLDRADELRRIVGMNLLRSSAIQAAQNPMKVIGAACVRTFSQPLPQFFRALRAGEKSFEQGAQVESGSSHQDRQVSPRFDLVKHLPRLAGVVAGSDMAGGRDAIEQVMPSTGPF